MTIAVDHEYIPENAAQGDIPGERPDVKKVYCEVMQMGACRLDEAGNEIDVLNLTVKAHRIHTIPPWLSKMTGMTEERREREGVDSIFTPHACIGENVDTLGSNVR